MCEGVIIYILKTELTWQLKTNLVQRQRMKKGKHRYDLDELSCGKKLKFHSGKYRE